MIEIGPEVSCDISIDLKIGKLQIRLLPEQEDVIRKYYEST